MNVSPEDSEAASSQAEVRVLRARCKLCEHSTCLPRVTPHAPDLSLRPPDGCLSSLSS